MSKYINTSSYKNMFSISKKLFDLLETNNVINHIKISSYDLRESNITTLEDNQDIPPKAVQLKAQFKKIYGAASIYEMITFDSYGKIRETKTFENKRFLKQAFIRYSNGKFYSHKYNNFGKIKRRSHIDDWVVDFNDLLSYHKQRVSKKITSDIFVSNEKDLKIEVYKWLLKKNKDAVIIPEYTVENRRADYISFDTKKINCTIVEIKSELDTFERLEAQLDTYSKIANIVYLAIDKKQYEKLISKNIIIPGHIGLLIFDNSKRKKLDEVKKASKLSHRKDYQFIPFLSYSDINNSFVGFKYHSKLSKEQKEKFIEQSINKEIINRFAYDVLCNRFIIESDRRKEYLKNGDIDNAVASSKELKINRFDIEGKYSMTLHKYVADKDILYNYFINQENTLLEEFKDIPNFKDYIKNGSDKLNDLITYIKQDKINFYLNGLSNSHIFASKSTKNNYKIDNQIAFLESLLRNKEVVIDYFKGVN
jgi:hypothetical protein